MSEQDPNFITWAAGGFLTLMSWAGMRQVKRIDNIEDKLSHCVSRTELNGKLNRIEDKVQHIYDILTKHKE